MGRHHRIGLGATDRLAVCDAHGVEFLRTPDERFARLPGYSFAPHYQDVGDGMRMHFVDEGPRDGDVVLLLHGEPSWSFLYRKMIPILVDAGLRAVAPDLIGFGRSDKPSQRSDYSYASHMRWLKAFVDGVGLGAINLVCQDWGGLLGLRYVGEEPDRFARVVAANTFLPTGREPLGEAFLKWREFSQTSPKFDIGIVIDRGTVSELSADVIAAYNAPFPDERYKEGARQFPALVPDSPDAPGATENQAAWMGLMTFAKPFLTAFSDQDPVTRGADKLLRAVIPGCKGQAHTTIANGGHFLQEDQGEALARVVVELVRST